MERLDFEDVTASSRIFVGCGEGGLSYRSGEHLEPGVRAALEIEEPAELDKSGCDG